MKKALIQFNLFYIAIFVVVSLLLTSFSSQARHSSHCYRRGYNHHYGGGYHHGGNKRHYGGGYHHGGNKRHYGGGYHHGGHKRHFSYGFGLRGYHPRRHRHRRSHSFKYYYPRKYYSYYSSRSNPHYRFRRTDYIEDGTSNNGSYTNATKNNSNISYKPNNDLIVDNFKDYQERERKKGNYKSAWRDLVNNQPEKAMRKFGNLASSYPNTGMPKVGYALSAGLKGDHKRAEWAMRRAFRIDPEGIKFTTKNENLNYKVMELEDKYKLFANNSVNHPNPNFMHAAVSYLQKDFETAKASISKAIESGDDRESTQNLHTLLQQTVSVVDN